MTKEMIFGGLAFLFLFVISDAKAQSAASQQPSAYIATGPDFAGDVPGEMIQIKSRTKIGLFDSNRCARLSKKIQLTKLGLSKRDNR